MYFTEFQRVLADRAAAYSPHSVLPPLMRKNLAIHQVDVACLDTIQRHAIRSAFSHENRFAVSSCHRNGGAA
jgi:hypothetical protein